MMQKKIISFLILLLEVHINYGQKISMGSCGNVKPMKNFKIEKYAGTWYTIFEHPNIFTFMGQCQKLTYTLSSPNTLDWVFTQKTIVPFLDNIEGKNVQTSPGVFSLSINDIPSDLFELNHIVLDTDYKKYSVVYSCNEFFGFKIEFAHVLSKKEYCQKNGHGHDSDSDSHEHYHHRHHNIEEKAIKILNKENIDIDNLNRVDQRNC